MVVLWWLDNDKEGSNSSSVNLFSCFPSSPLPAHDGVDFKTSNGVEGSYRTLAFRGLLTSGVALAAQLLSNDILDYESSMNPN
ncbi:alpha-amylase [Sesbania bispinosa]|nr:alpha-amylase [Sesbania bispinosa]